MGQQDKEIYLYQDNWLSLQAVHSLKAWEKSRDSTSNSKKVEDMQSTIDDFSYTK